MKLVNGINPYENTHTDIFTYVKVPPQVSQYEPLYVHRMTTSDKIDTGQNVHIRVHSGYNVELIASSHFLLSDTHLVLKVQDPSKVGGAYDHPSLNRQSNFDRIFNSRNIKAYKAFEKYVLQGDTALYY